jgi:hypothetical protein
VFISVVVEIVNADGAWMTDVKMNHLHLADPTILVIRVPNSDKPNNDALYNVHRIDGYRKR